jgi:predicted permease
MQLLYGVLAAMPFIAMRLGYGVASLILELEHPTSSFLTSLPVKVVLSLVTEVLVQTILISAGLLTLDANRVFSQTKDQV